MIKRFNFRFIDKRELFQSFFMRVFVRRRVQFCACLLQWYKMAKIVFDDYVPKNFFVGFHPSNNIESNKTKITLLPWLFPINAGYASFNYTIEKLGKRLDFEATILTEFDDISIIKGYQSFKWMTIKCKCENIIML